MGWRQLQRAAAGVLHLKSKCVHPSGMSLPHLTRGPPWDLRAVGHCVPAPLGGSWQGAGDRGRSALGHRVPQLIILSLSLFLSTTEEAPTTPFHVRRGNEGGGPIANKSSTPDTPSFEHPDRPPSHLRTGHETRRSAQSAVHAAPVGFYNFHHKSSSCGRAGVYALRIPSPPSLDLSSSNCSAWPAEQDPTPRWPDIFVSKAMMREGEDPARRMPDSFFSLSHQVLLNGCASSPPSAQRSTAPPSRPGRRGTDRRLCMLR